MHETFKMFTFCCNWIFAKFYHLVVENALSDSKQKSLSADLNTNEREGG